MQVSVSLIGFGEAGQAFAQAGGWGAAARAYDKLTDQVETRAAKEADYAAAGVHGVGTAAAAVAGTDLVLSLVTADEAIAAARSVAGALKAGALYFDFNSVAPQTKRQAAATIESAGGRYVDVAVMAPVQPKALAVPLLVSGPHAAEGAAALRGLGFAPRVVDGPVGRASTIKMLRSIIVKGIEALTAECFLAAEAAGVADEVARSLDESEVRRSWRERADYNLERMRSHGLRRAAEMEEVARTVAAIEGDAPMAVATATVQRRIAEAAAATETRNEAA
jgi:3-hydroxyisobutyrate dehydrogenase-like beta-hydroxyacid dehydrogenase